MQRMREVKRKKERERVNLIFPIKTSDPLKLNSILYTRYIGESWGAMKRDRGTCSMFQSFQLTHNARTTFIEIYRQGSVKNHLVKTLQVILLK